MFKDIVRRGTLYTINVLEIVEDVVTATFVVANTRPFKVHVSNLLKRITKTKDLVDSLDAHSRFYLLHDLRSDPTKKIVECGMIVKVQIGKKLSHGVVIAIQDNGVDVWVVGTDRMRFTTFDWSLILPTSNRASVGMQTQPHTIPVETYTNLNEKYKD